MEPSIKALIDSGHTITGLLHIGANDGEEVPHYQSLGIKKMALFEPLHDPYLIACANHESEHVKIFHFGLLDRTAKISMNVTENNKASSILELIPVPDWHEHEVLKDWNMGQMPVIGHENCYFERYDSLAGDNNSDFDASIYNAAVIDTQGTEDQTLAGFGKFIKFLDYILIELSEKPVYAGQFSGDIISSYLQDKGFEQVTPMKLHDNVLFIRKGK